MKMDLLKAAFAEFERRYSLPPVFLMARGDQLSAFIITKGGESFMISFDSKPEDIKEAAKLIGDGSDEVCKDIAVLAAHCTAPEGMVPAPEKLQ